MKTDNGSTLFLNGLRSPAPYYPEVCVLSVSGYLSEVELPKRLLPRAAMIIKVPHTSTRILPSHPFAYYHLTHGFIFDFHICR